MNIAGIMMPIQVGFLKSIPYFAGLKPEELTSVARFISERQAGRNELIESEGEEARVLHFVVSGIVKVFKTSAEGKEQILSLVRPGESFNDVPVFAGENLTSAEAMSPVTLYELQKPDIKRLIQDHPQLALNIIQVLSGRVEHLTSLVEDLSFRPVMRRIAKILLENGGGSGSPRLTQQEMAAMAGTAREMVGRSLRALEEEGAIRLDHHRIIITNKSELEEIAQMR